MDTYGLLTIIFLILITAIDFYFVRTSQEKKRVWTKPLIIPFIVLLYVQFTRQINISLLMALAFSFFGDCFLLFSGKKHFFQLGLFSFLSSHILYIYTFTGGISFGVIAPVKFLLLIMLYLIYAWFFLKSLKPYLGHYLIPVILYMITIIGMSYTSLLRFWVIQGFSFWFPFMGSLFFIFSDTLLAIRNFRYGLKKGWVLVMLSYVLGQLFIVLGFI